jgi:flagellar basal-body rod protein FlgB
MSHAIEAMTVPSLSAALDAAVLRQQAIATNIANANTPGYTPVRLRFDAAWADAERADGGRGGAPALTLKPVALHAGGAAVDGSVKLDQEVAAMSQNSAHYQALLRGLNRYFSLMASAASEGRR